MRRKSICLSLFILLVVQSIYAQGARKGWTKLELSAVDEKSTSAPAALLTRFGAELIGDYGAFAIVYVPKGVVTALEAQAKQNNIRVRERDELDLVQLPGATVDAREGISGVPADKLIREYPAGKPGVYVLQFIGPPRNEWISQLQTAGWRLSRYIPNNAYLAVGTTDLVAQARQLPFVQWLDFYHPYQKPAQLAHDTQLHDDLFELAEGPGSELAIAAIRSAATGDIDVQKNAYDTRVYARMSDADAEKLLRNEMILSVGPRPRGGFSDERQVMSLTSNLDSTGSQPTNPGGYWNWVLSRCTECNSMPSSTWKVGIADGGLDNGANTGGHLDFWGRKYFGNKFYTDLDDPECAPGQLLCDAYSHGTLVAGIAVGTPATGDINGPYKDTLNFTLGQGVAPTAGAFATKIYSVDSTKPGHGGINPAGIFSWATDAANAGVTIQNHSWNEYSSHNAGSYSTVSRDYDIATRDADGTANFSRVPMLFSISSGNNDQGQFEFKYLTLAGATAKNVLSVGGLENYRPEQDFAANCRLVRGDSFRNIMRTSRVGTQDSGYFKPDVMAPASLIVSAFTSALWPTTSAYCLHDFLGRHEYTGDSGTSFAAPVGAAASLIVKRYLGTSPSDVSPALTRAVLIAGARTVRNGEDRTHDSGATLISAIPSQQQGFGRLSFEDILNGAQKPVVYDQSASRTFTAAGQSFSTTLHVHDSTKPVKIALVWSDTPGTAGSISPLVNDLNLEVRRSSNPNVVYVGNSMAVTSSDEQSIAWPSTGSLPYDQKNNVEVFRLFANAGEDLTITVKAANIAGDTDGNTSTFEQDFALAVLNVDNPCVPGVITQQPVSQTIIPGASANLTVSVSGTGPFNYQWYRATSPNFNNPVGNGQIVLNTGPLTTTQPFWVHITDTCVGGFLYSNTATITVQCTAAPSITQQPTSRVTTSGQSTTLSVAATQAVSYQWYQGMYPSGTAISGATNPTLTVAPTATTNYWVRVTNGCGTADSVTATVCVLPLITAQPTSRTIFTGQSTTLTVTAAGATTYQWFQGTTPVGTNSSSLTVSPTTTTSYKVRVSNSCGSVDSNVATVTVTTPPPPQISRIQTSFALANSQQTITANWTQPTQAGTFLVAVISSETYPNGYVTFTPPAGWSQAVTSEWNDIKLSIFYLPNNGGARTSETFSVSPGFHDMTLYILEYGGIATVNPFDKSGLTGNSTNNGYVQTGFTPNTSQANELVITALTTYTQTDFSVTPADGYTEIYDKQVLYHLTTAMYEKIATSIASYGHGANVGVPAEWVGVVATFRGAN